MTQTPLYLIGNGFDLWHGIPSSYRHFKAYVKAHDQELSRISEAYLPAEEDWSDLESSLADIDVDYIIDDLGHFMSCYGADDWSDSAYHDFQIEVERVVENLSEGLKRQFATWIRKLCIPTPETAPRLLKTIDPAALFLSFNYTPTLRTMYGIPDAQVLHIHGRADRPDSDLILGHAWNPHTRRSLNYRHDIEELDTRQVEAFELLDDYFSRTFKPSQRIIEANARFFEQLTDVETIWVLGHSLLAVDAPYFHAILSVPEISKACWQVAYRLEEDDPSEKVEQLVSLGVAQNKISTLPWSAL
ncbi:MAG TPA: bacteriophage abortive infection AbiH family protein [Azonexus sp.]|nr:bacteriophage abortive infection AbiH family protein [Azonexus sp.]